jgi:urease accessory protein
MTFVGVEVGVGRARLTLRGGDLAPRVISQDATGAKVALVATTALLLGGDQVDLELRISPGAWLEIVETAGLVAYDAGGTMSGWRLRATIGDGALLVWQGEPFVVADGANVLRSSHFNLGEESTLCIRETVVFGRTGETGGSARIRNRISRGNFPLLVESLDLTDRATRELPGIIGPARVVDTVTLVGAPVPTAPILPVGSAFALSGAAGTVGRVLRTSLAGSPVPAWWSAWSAAARAGRIAAARAAHVTASDQTVVGSATGRRGANAGASTTSIAVVTSGTT